MSLGAPGAHDVVLMEETADPVVLHLTRADRARIPDVWLEAFGPSGAEVLVAGIRFPPVS